MAKFGGGDVKQLLLQVDASVDGARRDLNQLSADVQTHSAKMDASLAKVDGSFGRIGAGITKVGGLMAAAGLTIGVGTFVELGRSALEFADNLEAAAEQAGMGVERYQTLKGALRALEVEGDKVEKAFESLQTTLGDVQKGADNGATQALERLGIRSKILNGEIDTSDELLDALAAAAENAGSKAQFTSEMVEIFGKKVGVDMANALADGGKALHQGEEDMRSYGAVMSEELVAKTAKANEQIQFTLEQASVHFKIFAAEAIQSIKSVIAWYNSLPSAGQIAAVATAISNPAATIGIVASFARPDKPSANEAALARARTRLRTTQQRAAIPGADYSASVEFAQAKSEVDRLTRAVEAEAKPKPKADGPAIKPPKTPRARGGAARRKPRGGGGRSTQAKKADLSRRSLSSLEEGLPPWERLDDPVPNFILSLEDDKPLTNLLGIADTTADIQGMLADMPPVPDLSKMLAVEEQERIRGFIADFQQDLASGLTDAIMSGEDLGEVLENSFKRAAAALIESGLLLLLQQLASAMGYGSPSGGGEANLVGSLFSAFKGRASGGPVSARTPYIVGERGPELFVPRISGDIVPNHALGRGGRPERVEVLVSASEDFQVKVAHTAGAVVRMAAPGIAARASGDVMTQLFRPRLASGID